MQIIVDKMILITAALIKERKWHIRTILLTTIITISNEN